MAQEALTGFRKYKTPYVSQINAKTPFLSSLYNLKAQNEYRDKQNELTQRGLDLQEETAHQARKRDRTATNLGYANTALNAGFGLAKNWDNISNLFNTGDAVSEVVPSGSESYLGDMFGGATDWIANEITSPFKNVTDWADFGGIFDGLLDNTVSFEPSDFDLSDLTMGY